MSTRTVSLAVALLVASCGGTINYDHSAEPDPRKQPYVVGVSDRLLLTVWKNPDLSGDHTVRPDGTITVPLLGDVVAEGKTTAELEKVITKKLAQFIKDEGAVVTVGVSEVNSYRFTVSGEVTQRGVFRSKNYVTVVEAIMLAGGFTRFAKKDQISISRCCNEDGSRRRIPIDYNAIIGGNSVMNIVLLTGDEVYVP